MTDVTPPACICRVTGPAPSQTRFNPECPYHGKGGTMVEVIRVKNGRVVTGA